MFYLNTKDYIYIIYYTIICTRVDWKVSDLNMKIAALVNKSLGMCLRMLWKVLTKFSAIFEYAYANYNSFFKLAYCFSKTNIY